METPPVFQETSYIAASGEKILRHEVTVHASLSEVWKIFTTGEGLRSVIAPVAEIDFRLGGIWEATYDPKGKIGDPNNILNRVISYLPMEMISIQISRTPPGFPFSEVAKQIWTVIQFKEIDDQHVRIVTSMLGWKEGKDWQTVYNLFQQDNAIESQRLYERFKSGPRKWN